MVIYIVFFLRQTPQRCWKLIVLVNGMVDLTLRTGRTSVPFIYFTFSQRTFHFERSERPWKPKNSEPRCKCDKMVNGTREFQRLPFQKFSFSPKISSSLKWKIVFIFILTEISGNFSKWKTNYTSGVSSLGRTSATDMSYLVSNYHIRFSRLENFRLINLSTQDLSNIWLFTITLPDVVFVFIKDVFFFVIFLFWLCQPVQLECIKNWFAVSSCAEKRFYLYWKDRQPDHEIRECHPLAFLKYKQVTAIN